MNISAGDRDDAVGAVATATATAAGDITAGIANAAFGLSGDACRVSAYGVEFFLQSH